MCHLPVCVELREPGATAQQLGVELPSPQSFFFVADIVGCCSLAFRNRHGIYEVLMSLFMNERTAKVYFSVNVRQCYSTEEKRFLGLIERSSFHFV
jgi:hypothetical protein